jgi:hypothetical protein
MASFEASIMADTPIEDHEAEITGYSLQGEGGFS